MHEFVEEVAVLSRWLGRDLAPDLIGVVPVWHAFRFRDAAVFGSDAAGSAGAMYLVRRAAVREFVPSQTTIDDAYAELDRGGQLRIPAVA